MKTKNWIIRLEKEIALWTDMKMTSGNEEWDQKIDLLQCKLSEYKLKLLLEETTEAEAFIPVEALECGCCGQTSIPQEAGNFCAHCEASDWVGEDVVLHPYECCKRKNCVFCEKYECKESGTCCGCIHNRGENCSWRTCKRCVECKQKRKNSVCTNISCDYYEFDGCSTCGNFECDDPIRCENTSGLGSWW